MAITRMTLEEMQKKYPLTKKALAKIEKACKKEPDMTDPDAPDIVDLLEKGLAHRIGRPKKAYCKKLLTIRVEPFTLRSLRMSGKGWQTRLSDWIDDGVRKGVFTIAQRKN